MSNAIYTSELPTDVDIYVGDFTSAVKNQKGTGVNFKGAVCKDQHGKVLASGDLFLFDSVLEDRGNPQPITAIFMLSTRPKDDGTGFWWNYHPISQKSDGTLVKVIDVAEAPEKKEWKGGGGGGRPKKPARSCEEIDALHDKAIAKIANSLAEMEIAPDKDVRGFAALVNTRFIAYNEQTPVGDTPDAKKAPDNQDHTPDDSDIPF